MFPAQQQIKLNQALADIEQEYSRARMKHRPMNSRHEGYAVIKEEVDELWDEIKKREPSPENLRKEAIQIGAMILAFLLEVA